MKKGLSIVLLRTDTRNHKRLFLALWASCCLHFFIIYGEFIGIPKAAPPLQAQTIAITLKPLSLNQPNFNKNSIATNQTATQVRDASSFRPKSKPKKTAQQNPNKNPKKPIIKSPPKRLATTPSNMADQLQSSQETSQLDQTGMASDAFYLGDNTFIEGDLSNRAAANLAKKSSETVPTPEPIQPEPIQPEPPVLGVKTDKKGFLSPRKP